MAQSRVHWHAICCKTGGLPACKYRLFAYIFASVNPLFPAKRYSAEVIEACFQLFARDRSLAEIEKLQSVPYGTLRGWSRKGKWKARRDAMQGRMAHVIETNVRRQSADCQTGILDADARDNASLSDIELETKSRRDAHERMSFDEKQREYHTQSALEALRILDAIRNTPTSDLVQRADKISKLDAMARKALNLDEHKPSVVVNVGLLSNLATRRRLKASSATVLHNTADSVPVLLEAADVSAEPEFGGH